jgi:hypothetical protein
MSQLVPAPLGNKQDTEVNPLTLTPLHAFDAPGDDLTWTTVFKNDVPKFLPCMVIRTPPEVGAPEAAVTLSIMGAS